MRLFGLTVATLGLVVLLPGSIDAAADRPALKIVDRDPLTLGGRFFQPDETVRIVVTPELQKPRIAKAQASEAGVFRHAFRGVRLDRCSGGLEVAVVGSKGSRVSFVLRKPHCGGGADV